MSHSLSVVVMWNHGAADEAGPFQLGYLPLDRLPLSTRSDEDLPNDGWCFDVDRPSAEDIEDLVNLFGRVRDPFADDGPVLTLDLLVDGSPSAWSTDRVLEYRGGSGDPDDQLCFYVLHAYDETCDSAPCVYLTLHKRSWNGSNSTSCSFEVCFPEAPSPERREQEDVTSLRCGLRSCEQVYMDLCNSLLRPSYFALLSPEEVTLYQ